MTTLTRTIVPPAPAVAPIARSTATEQRVTLCGIRWETYEALLADVGKRPIRLTYDRGNLEIMAPSFRHESYSAVLGRVVELLAEELNIPFKSGWSTTFRRQDLQRGLEPDRCFYIRNALRIVGKMEIDLSQDPPPDLAIEIDIGSSSLDRMGIYAALGVPAVWRFDGERLQVYQLSAAGTYQLVEASPTFPMLSLTEVVPLIQQVVTLDDLSQVRLIRAWVREQLLLNRQDTPKGLE